MQDAGGNEYPPNEQQTNTKWFCNLLRVDMKSMAMCARDLCGAQVASPTRVKGALLLFFYYQQVDLNKSLASNVRTYM